MRNHAIACLASGLALAVAGAAGATPTPSGGTISPATPSLAYSSGPFTGANVTGQTGEDPICFSNTCDDYALTVDIPQSYRDANPDFIVTISVGWPDRSDDFDIYLFDAADRRVGAGPGGDDPEVIIVPLGSLPNGNYIIRTVTFTVTDESYNATVNLGEPPPPPPNDRSVAIYVPGTDVFSCNTHLTGSTPAFSHDADGEPSIKTDKDGKIYVTSNAGLGGGIGLWRITDLCGRQFSFLGSPDGGAGGGDTDVEIASTKNLNGFYNIYTSSLSLANVTSSVSLDGGANFVPTVVSDLTPVNDRQWNAAYGASTIYLSFRTLNLGNQLIAYRSDGAGLPGTWVGPFFVYSDVVTDATLNTQLGNMVADNRPVPDGTLPGMAGPNGEGNVYHGFCLLPNKIYVAVSKNFGVTWSSKLVYQGSDLDNFRFDFTSVAVDQAGNIYTAFSDQYAIWYCVSRDQGDTWSHPFRVSSGADNKTAIFVEMDAGSPGQSVFTWYGSSSRIGVQDPSAKYHVFHARCDNALAPLDGGIPVFEQVRVTDHVMHTGVVCLAGISCASGTRELLENFEIAINPFDGSSAITYTDDGLEGGTYFSRQLAGKSAIQGKVVTDHSNDCQRNTNGCQGIAVGDPCEVPGVTVVSDAQGDELPPNGQQDIVSVSVAEPRTALGQLAFTIQVRSMDPGNITPNGQWRVIWNSPVGEYFVSMLRCATETSPHFTYGDFMGTAGASRTLGDADNGTVGADGSIVIYLAKSKVGNPQPGMVLTGIEGDARERTGNCPGGPAVLAGVDVTGTGSYTLVPAGFCSPVPALISSFDASPSGDDVLLSWSSYAVDQVKAWNVYRGGSPDAAVERVNGEPIPMGSGGSFSVRDASAVSGAIYYKLSAVGNDGSERQVALASYTTDVASGAFHFGLAGGNPFRDFTTLSYSLPEAAPVRIAVYNLAGERVRTLVDGRQPAGTHQVSLARTSAETRLGPGVYFVKITAGKWSDSHTVIAVD